MEFICTQADITELELSEIEEKLNVKFTEEYKTHILNHNGGGPLYYYYKTFDFARFYSLRYGDEKLSKIVKKLKGQIPDGFLPIAFDPESNEFCINTNEGEEYGYIYMILTDEDENPLPDKEPILVAKSLNEVLNNLREHPSE